MIVKSLSHVQLLATPWTVAYQAPPSMGFPRQECWSGLPGPSPMSPLLGLKGRNGGFHGGSVIKNLPCNAGDTGSIPGLRRSHILHGN